MEKSCKTCKWWDGQPPLKDNSKIPMGICQFPETLNLFFYLSSDKARLYTRADFGCKGHEG